MTHSHCYMLWTKAIMKRSSELPVCMEFVLVNCFIQIIFFKHFIFIYLFHFLVYITCPSKQQTIHPSIHFPIRLSCVWLQRCWSQLFLIVLCQINYITIIVKILNFLRSPSSQNMPNYTVKNEQIQCIIFIKYYLENICIVVKYYTVPLWILTSSCSLKTTGVSSYFFN